MVLLGEPVERILRHRPERRDGPGGEVPGGELADPRLTIIHSSQLNEPPLVFAAASRDPL